MNKARMLVAMKRIGVASILLLAFLGLADSAYLAQHEIAGTPLICNIQIQSLSGCNIVAQSGYSHIFGVPVAVFGILFYAVLFVIAALELVLYDQLLRRVLQGIASIGLLVSIYFETVQFVLIKAFCIYCAASAIITLIVFILATRIEPIRKQRQGTAAPVSTAPTPSTR